MSSKEERRDLPLSNNLLGNLPEFMGFLEELFELSTPNKQPQKPKTLQQFKKWLIPVVNALNKRYRLSLACKHKRAGKNVSAIMLICNDNTRDIVTFEISTKSLLITLCGLRIRHNDDSKTLFDEEAFYLLLKGSGKDLFIENVLKVFGHPSRNCLRSGRAYERALIMVEKSKYHNSDNYRYLKQQHELLKDFLDKIFGSHQMVMDKVKLLYTEAKSGETSYKIVDIINFECDYFVVEISVNSAVLALDFADICQGEGKQWFNPEQMVAAIHGNNDPNAYVSSIIKALKAFEMFSSRFSQTEQMRRRVLRLMLNTPEQV